MSEIITYLKGKQKALDACAQSLTARQLIQHASIAIHMSPKLRQCTKESIYEALLIAARMGLDCSGLHNHGYLVPRGKKCVFQAGWAGLVTLAIRGGACLDIYANCLYENDRYEYREGTKRVLDHWPPLTGDRGDLLCAYACAILPDGRETFEVVPREKLDRIANETRNPVWRSHFYEMAKKTALRQLCARLPKSLELADALDLDAAAEGDRLPASSLRDIEPELLAANPDNAAEEVKARIKKRKPRRRTQKGQEEPKAIEEAPADTEAEIIARNNAAVSNPAAVEEIPF